MTQEIAQIWTKNERAVWHIPPRLTVSQWADRHRVLDARTSSEPGQWRTDRAPYLRGIMDSFSDSDVEIIDVQKSVQSGGTESMLNMIGYCVSQEPGPSLLVMPREEDCSYTAENRLRPMVQGSNELKIHTTERIWDLNKKEFYLDNMTLYFAGSNSPAALKAKPVKNLFRDETNDYPPFVGRDVNPMDMSERRTTTFWDRKIVNISTATTTDGYITVSYESSNMQEYYIPCPRCGEYQIWIFEQLKIPKELRAPDKVRKSEGQVWYECEHCAGRIEQTEKTELVAAGKWVPDGQTIDAEGKLHGRPNRDKRHSGFRFSALISPWVRWEEIMARWFEANTEQGIALGQLMDFHNNFLGLAFRETGKKVTTSQLEGLKGGYSKGTVPAGCQILVAGADYHKSKTRGIVRIDYEVRGFGYGLKNWVIDSGSVYSFEQLDEKVLLKTFPWAGVTPSEESPELAVTILFVDSKYEPDDVNDYCLQRPGLTFPTQGMPGPRMKPLQTVKVEDSTAQRLSRRQRARYRGLLSILIDTYYFKNQVTSWVEGKYDKDGKLTARPLTLFYDEIPWHYFTEFCNENKVPVRDTKGNVRMQWLPVTKGAQTHSLDTAVLCAAAAFYRGVHRLMDPNRGPKQAAAAKQTVKKKKRKARPRGTGFLDNLPQF